MQLRVAIIIPPLRREVSSYPPFGALSVISAAREDGHNVRLFDWDAHRCNLEQAVMQISSFSPHVVGISAVVATSYKYVKELSGLIKKRLPETVIVMGGGLSSAGETVLKNTHVGLVVYGEGEITFKEVLKKIEEKRGYEGIKGILFKKGEQVIQNEPRALISNLDALPFPDYDELDLTKYILNIRQVLEGYGDHEKIDERVKDPRKSLNCLRISVSRGCVNRCTFCFRNIPGLRIHSFDYIGDLIGYVKNKYDLGHISFADECFGPTKKWLWGFIEMLRKRKFDLTYHITGMRVNVVDLDILKALKELGVWHIQFGFESGSQKILNIMQKGTTVQENINVVQMLDQVGINTIPFIIIGYPGETPETFYETVNFLRKANLMSECFRPTLPMAMPGTPLFEYAKLKGYITDEDKYLESISDVEADNLSEDNYFINYTESPSSVVMKWMAVLQDENRKYSNEKSNIKLIKRIIEKLKSRGLKETVKSVFFRLAVKIEGKRLKKRCAKKEGPLSSKNEASPMKETSIPEIPPEGESLRKVNRRLMERMASENRQKEVAAI